MSVLVDYTSGAFAANKAQDVGTISGSDIDVSSGNYFAYTPTTNTTFTFSNAPASGTATGFALALTGANVTVGYDLANASYDSVSFSDSGRVGGPNALAFNQTGTKLYFGDYLTDTLYQYTLSTAFDISTASYDSVSFSVASQDNTLADLAFNSDGTKMYVVGNSTDTVYQYSLSTAFDLSTASYDSVSFSVATQATSPQGVSFNQNGTKMFILCSGTDAIYQYTLSTAFDISTASYDSASFSVASQDTSPLGCAFNSSGTKMIVLGFGTDTLYQYTLSTAFDLSTASYDSVSFSVATQATFPRAIAFNSDGSKAYVADDSSDTIYQYTTGTSTPATLTYPASVDWPAATAPAAPAAGETDVLVFYTEDGGTNWYGFQAGDAMA